MVIILTTIIVVGTSVPVEDNHKVCVLAIPTVMVHVWSIVVYSVQYIRLHVTRGSLLVIISLKMWLVKRPVQPTCHMIPLASCMLSVENAVTVHRPVLTCATIHSCMPKIHRQLSLPPGNALEPLMCTSIVLPLVMVQPQPWDSRITIMAMLIVIWNIVDQTTAVVGWSTSNSCFSALHCTLLYPYTELYTL